MRRLLAVHAVAGLLLGLAVLNAPTASAAPLLRFKTPEAAMRYLAGAYNREDDSALRKVTNPDARYMLETYWRPMAVNLALKRCVGTERGVYECEFTHDYPSAIRGATPKPGGFAWMIAAPVSRRGWVAKFGGCG